MLPNITLRSLRVNAEASLEDRHPLLPRLNGSQPTSTLQEHRIRCAQACGTSKALPSWVLLPCMKTTT